MSRGQRLSFLAVAVVIAVVAIVVLAGGSEDTSGDTDRRHRHAGRDQPARGRSDG